MLIASAIDCGKRIGVSPTRQPKVTVPMYANSGGKTKSHSANPKNTFAALGDSSASAVKIVDGLSRTLPSRNIEKVPVIADYRSGRVLEHEQPRPGIRHR